MRPDEFADEDAPEPEPAAPRPDLAGVLISASGLLVLAFGVLLLITPVGDNQNVAAADVGVLESLGIAVVGVVLMVAAPWRRERSAISVPMAGIGLLVAVACLAVVGAAWLAIVPAAGLLALINRPFPTRFDRPGD